MERIVFVTHTVTPWNYEKESYPFGSFWKYFPQKLLHDFDWNAINLSFWMLNESNLPCFRSSMCEKFWCYGKQNTPSPYNRWKTTKEIAFINRHLDIPGDLKEYCLILFCFFKLITELPSEKKKKEINYWQNCNDFSTWLIWKKMSEFSSKIVEFIVRRLWQSTTSQWNLSAIKEEKTLGQELA